MASASDLRERKKQQTRTGLIRAGLTMMDREGYETATAGAIAEAAGVSRATFFNYFTSKEWLVLATAPTLHRDLMADALASHAPDAPVRSALRTAVHEMIQHPGWPFAADDELAAIRARLLCDVPALRAAYLGELADLQREWTDQVADAYPTMQRIEVAALVGATIGAITNAVLDHIRQSGSADEIPAVVEQAGRTALD